MPFLLAKSITAANTSGANEVVVLGPEEIIDEDYFAVGDSVEIYGTVNGDAYVAGGLVIIEGIINGDLLVAGGTVQIPGDVSQDVRVLGGDVTITGNIGRNLSFGAGNINISESSTIGGSIAGGAGSVVVSAPVEGNANIAAGSITISSSINGKVNAGVDQLRLTPQAKIGGDLVYWSDFDASIDENATISGQTTKKVGIVPQERDNKTTRALYSGFTIYWLLATLTFGLIFVHLFPKASTNTSDVLTKKPGQSLIAGLIVLLFTPPVIFVIAITLIGIPIAAVLALIYILYLYLAKFFVMVWAGNWILQKFGKKESAKKAFALGLLAFAVLRWIPVVSFFVYLIVLVFGLGAMSLLTRERYLKSKTKKG